MLNDAQKQAHYSGIGGSNAAAVCGLNRYKTPLHVYYELTDENYRIKSQEEIESKESVRFGNILENAIAGEAAQRLDVFIEKINEPIYDTQYPFMIANPDRKIINQPAILEIKNRDKFFYYIYKDDDIMEEEFIQCQHYMRVMKLDIAYLCALVGGNRLFIAEVPRDDDIIEMIIAKELDFWESHIEKKIPPEPNWDRNNSDLFKKIYPETNGEIIELGDDIMHWHRVLEDSKMLAKRYQTMADGAKNYITHKMGHASIGRLPDGSEYIRKKIKKKGFSVPETEYIQMIHRKAKK